MMGDDWNGKSHHLTGFDFVLAGAMTGVMTRFLCQPLDVLKIRFQLQVTPLQSKKPVKYTSVMQAFRLMVVEEGVSSLWKGHLAAQLLSISFGAVQFSTYETLYDFGHKTWPNKQQWSEHLLSTCCGTAAGLTATVVSFPFDVIRTHLIFQGEPKIYKGIFDAVSQIYRKEGVRGFRKGLTAAIIQTAPMSGLTFSFQGIFREIWLWFFTQTDARAPASLTTSGIVVTSLLAGVCAKTIVYPLDLMKKRLQIQGFDVKRSCSRSVIKCSGILECFLLTIRREGYLGLFKGLVPSVMKAGASTAIYFTMYEKACNFIEYSRKV